MSEPTNAEIVNCFEALQHFAEERIDYELSLAISDFERKISPKAIDIRNLQRKIATEHALLNGDEQPKINTSLDGSMSITIDPSKIEAYQTEFERLMDMKCSDPPRLKGSLLKGLELPHKVIRAIYPFLDRDE